MVLEEQIRDSELQSECPNSLYYRFWEIKNGEKPLGTAYQNCNSTLEAWWFNDLSRSLSILVIDLFLLSIAFLNTRHFIMANKLSYFIYMFSNKFKFIFGFTLLNLSMYLPWWAEGPAVGIGILNFQICNKTKHC